MMLPTLQYLGRKYPRLTSEHNAARWVMPFAQHLCKGQGFDIGAGRDAWALPGSIIVDPAVTPIYNAMRLPEGGEICYVAPSASKAIVADRVDYIFSSHCLEHLNDWVSTLFYWATRLRSGGVLFLYLPNMEHQEYWQPWHNRKHVNYLTPEILQRYMKDTMLWCNWFVTPGHDLNYSFTVIAERV